LSRVKPEQAIDDVEHDPDLSVVIPNSDIGMVVGGIDLSKPKNRWREGNIMVEVWYIYPANRGG
jgi:hypothetical protein